MNKESKNMKEEVDETLEEDEESLDEELEDEENEEDEGYELEDILSEKDLKQNSSRMHQFLMFQNNQSSLNQRAISPILNLEEDLPEPPKSKSLIYEEETKIDYLKKTEDSLPPYKPTKSSTNPTYAQSKELNASEEFGKERKKTLDNPLFDMKQSYR